MIIVSNLIRSVFVVLCFSMIVMELVAFFFLIFFFKEGIYKNNSNIEEQLNQMTKDILYSYNTLFTEAFTNIQTDLLLTTKHIYPFYLTKTGSKQNQYLQYTTDYINNFKGCLRPNLSINNLVPFLNNLDYSFTSPTQIDDLLNSKELNEVDYFYGNNDGIDKRDMENYACYVKSMLKTNYIKNLIIDKKHQISNNFTLYIGNNVFRYPSFGYLSKQYLLTELYYDKTDQNCINGYQLSCSLIKGSSLSNEIIFDDPVIDGWRRLITRGCIGTPFPSGIMEVESFACAYIDISAIYTDFTSQNNSILNLTFVSKKDNDVVVFYSMFHKENSQIPSQFKGVFNDSFFGQYEIKENDSKRYFSLFHYLYFDIVKINNPLGTLTYVPNGTISKFQWAKDYSLESFMKLSQDFHWNIVSTKRDSIIYIIELLSPLSFFWNKTCHVIYDVDVCVPTGKHFILTAFKSFSSWAGMLLNRYFISIKLLSILSLI